MATLFHLAPPDLAAAARTSGTLAPASLQSEGFAHASYLAQVERVANLVYRDEPALVALELDTTLISAEVRDEPATPEAAPDAWFPHVYGAIPWSSVRAQHTLGRTDVGFHLPPALQGRLDREDRQVEAWLAAWPWYDHPEGPQFVETHRDPYRTNGHWLFHDGAISAWHRVTDSEELWLLHHGRLWVHVLHHDTLTTHVLGLDAARGERPALAVPRGALQAAELAPGARVAFGSNVCAPCFQFTTSFELPSRGSLVAAHPEHRVLIERLTHDPEES